jgi:hypothetical protein
MQNKVNKRKSNEKKPLNEVVCAMTRIAPDLEFLDIAGPYVNNKSKVKLRCYASNHVFVRSIDSILNKKIISCVTCRGKNFGETLSLLIAYFILDSKQPLYSAREITPPWLEKKNTNGLGRLRYDGYFGEFFSTLGFAIAVEHQGPQHFDPNNSFHKKKKNPALAFELLQRSDQFKRDISPKFNVRLVEVSDLSQSQSIAECVNRVIDALFKKIPEIYTIQGAVERKEKLQSNQFFIHELLQHFGISSSAISKLKAQLKEEKSSVYVVLEVPTMKAVTLACREHPEQPNWTARLTNLIGSTVTDRKGTRCPMCKSEKIGKLKRLNKVQITAHAAKVGFIPAFDADTYLNNHQPLFWACIDCGSKVKRTLGQMSEDRGCPTCNLMIARGCEMNELRKIVEANGDVLLSSDAEYINQATRLRLICCRSSGCGDEYAMAAAKIKRGQLHACDKFARALATKKLSC